MAFTATMIADGSAVFTSDNIGKVYKAISNKLYWVLSHKLSCFDGPSDGYLPIADVINSEIWELGTNYLDMQSLVNMHLTLDVYLPTYPVFPPFTIQTLHFNMSEHAKGGSAN